MTASTSTNMQDSAFPKREFESKKDFLEHLYDLMISAYEPTEQTFGENRGHPRLLKTYIMESNTTAPENAETQGLIIERTKTKLSEISILTLRQIDIEKKVHFYLDTSDKRFWLLYTNALAKDAKDLFEKLVLSPCSSFDKIWLPRQLIEQIASMPRNNFRGFGLYYKDFFDLNQPTEKSVDWLKMRVSGRSSYDALEALRSKDNLRSSLAYSMIRIRRGDPPTKNEEPSNYVINELGYEGRFTAKGGSSIDAYISLIELTRQKYKATIENIERSSIGIKQVENRTLVMGEAFDLVLEREIENLGAFTDILVNSHEPFRLWGLKNKSTKGSFQVFGIDLHTGDQLDLEISSNLIRIYLPEGACGNTILRLYTNLQHYYDSGVKLNDKELPSG